MRILLNHDTYAQYVGHTLRDILTAVSEYTEPDVTPATSGIEIAERAFEIFNIRHMPLYGAPDPRAVEYRRHGHRPLAVGDVVCVDGHFFACEPFGWYEIDPPRETPSDRESTDQLD